MNRPWSRMLQLRPGIDKKKKRRVGSAGWGWGSSPKWQHHHYYTDPSLWIGNQRLRLECNCGQVNCLWTSCWNFLNDNFLIWKWRKYILHVVAIRTTQKKCLWNCLKICKLLLPFHYQACLVGQERQSLLKKSGLISSNTKQKLVESRKWCQA